MGFISTILVSMDKLLTIYDAVQGHGVENAMVQIDPDSFEMEDGEKTFVGVNPTGGCMIGCSGDLYSVHDLKLELLKCNPGKLTLTLDCCRTFNINVLRGNEKQYVRLRYIFGFLLI